MVLAAGVWIAAWWSVDVPILSGVLCVVFAIAVRRKSAMVLGLVLVASSLGSRAHVAYDDAVSTGYIDETIVVLSDTHSLGYGTRVDVKLEDGRRVELVGYGTEGSKLTNVAVGSSVEISGTMQPAHTRPWLKTRHIVGRISVDSVGTIEEAAGWRHPSEWLRSLVFGGSNVFSESNQALYTGLVIGDDRFQTVDQKAQFRAAGLTHLLAVSGQNVAFVLAVLSPVLLRLRRWLRWPTILAALAVFAMATRAEPSVLRATVSVGFATTLTLLGLKASGLRIVSLVTIALIFIDPFLARSVGFQLSVAASAGILVLGPILQSHRRLPAVIWTPLSVTIAAQVAVAPLLLLHFGRLGLVSIPANLLAGWAAGVVMMWGLTAGIVAGVLPTPVSEVVQFPATVLLWWIKTVADVSARVPAPVITVSMGLTLLGLSTVVLLVGRSTLLRIVLTALLLGQLLLLVPHPPEHKTDLGQALYLPSNDGDPSVLVVRSEASDQLIHWVVEKRLLEIDIVIFETGNRRSGELAQGLRKVAAIQTILAPAQHRVVGAHRVVGSITIESSTSIEVESTDTQLTVIVDGQRA